MRASQQALYIEAMSGQCWATVCGPGPTLTQHLFNIACLLGSVLFVFFTQDLSYDFELHVTGSLVYSPHLTIPRFSSDCILHPGS